MTFPEKSSHTMRMNIWTWRYASDKSGKVESISAYRWPARSDNNRKWGSSCRSISYAERSFAEMFPEHKCSRLCMTAEPSAAV